MKDKLILHITSRLKEMKDKLILHITRKLKEVKDNLILQVTRRLKEMKDKLILRVAVAGSDAARSVIGYSDVSIVWTVPAICDCLCPVSIHTSIAW